MALHSAAVMEMAASALLPPQSPAHATAALDSVATPAPATTAAFALDVLPSPPPIGDSDVDDSVELDPDSSDVSGLNDTIDAAPDWTLDVSLDPDSSLEGSTGVSSPGVLITPLSPLRESLDSPLPASLRSPRDDSLDAAVSPVLAASPALASPVASSPVLAASPAPLEVATPRRTLSNTSSPCSTEQARAAPAAAAAAATAVPSHVDVGASLLFAELGDVVAEDAVDAGDAPGADAEGTAAADAAALLLDGDVHGATSLLLSGLAPAPTADESIAHSGALSTRSALLKKWTAERSYALCTDDSFVRDRDGATATREVQFVRADITRVVIDKLTLRFISRDDLLVRPRVFRARTVGDAESWRLALRAAGWAVEAVEAKESESAEGVRSARQHNESAESKDERGADGTSTVTTGAEVSLGAKVLDDADASPEHRRPQVGSVAGSALSSRTDQIDSVLLAQHALANVNVPRSVVKHVDRYGGLPVPQSGLGRFHSVEDRNEFWERSQIAGTPEAAEAQRWQEELDDLKAAREHALRPDDLDAVACCMGCGGGGGGEGGGGCAVS
jgi:hypothetical protein